VRAAAPNRVLRVVSTSEGSGVVEGAGAVTGIGAGEGDEAVYIIDPEDTDGLGVDTAGEVDSAEAAEGAAIDRVTEARGHTAVDAVAAAGAAAAAGAHQTESPDTPASPAPDAPSASDLPEIPALPDTPDEASS
jgi:hypothetical protein